jgi:azurin
MHWGVLAPLICLPIARAAQKLSTPTELTIATDGDLLAFKPTELICPTGAHVRLTFFHTGKYIRQDHDWVLTVPGAAGAVAKAGLRAGESTGYLPHADKRVLAATPLCGKGEQVSVEFIAPAPGDYPFMCSYPGHDQFMHGVLHVTPR